MITPVLGARQFRRAAAQAIIAAATGIALFSPGDAAYGATFTFTTDFADMRDPNAWTPNGIPSGTDLAFIRRRGAGDTTNVDFTLDNGSITIGGFQYDTGLTRNVYNSVAGTTSTITFAGLPGKPLVEHTLTNGKFAFIGNQPGGGTLNLVLATSGEFRTNSGAQTFISANISEINGSQSITKGGQGSLVLAGNNTFTGDLTINTGSVLLSGTNTINKLMSASTTASVSSSLAGGLSVLGSAESHIGTLLMDMSSNPSAKIASTGSLIFTGGNIVQNGNASQAVAQSVAGAYINSGQSVLRVDVAGGGSLSFQGSTLNAGTLHRNLGAYLNINYATNSFTGALPVVTTSTGNDPTYGIIGPWLNVGNNDWATNSGGNVVAYTGYAVKDAVNTWASNENVTNSTSGSYSGTVPTGLTVGSVRFTSSVNNQVVTIGSGQTLTLGTGGIMVTGNTGATNSFTGGAITSGAGEILINTNGSKTLAINSVVADNGSALTVTKVGSGTLQLLGANTFTGGLFQDTGTIVVNSLANAGQPSSFGVNGLITLGTVNSVRVILPTLTTTMQSDRNFYLGEGDATLSLGAANNVGTLALTGNIDGPGGLTKLGGNANGTSFTSLSIGGSKTFGGPILVNGGLLSVDVLAPTGQASGLGTGTLDNTITLGNSSAGTLEYRGTVNASSDRPLQLGLPNNNNGGSINLVVTQPATLTWSGGVTYNSGTLASGTSASFNGASVTLQGTNQLNFRPLRLIAASGGAIVFNGSIGSGSGDTALAYGSVIKDGAGTVILGGTNVYKMGTQVNAGTLITLSNFSNGTIASNGGNSLFALSVNGNAVAVVSQKSMNNDPAGTTAIPWNANAATSSGLQLGNGGRLDLNNNAMVVYGAINPGDMSSIIRTFLKTGHDAGWGIGTSINGAIISTSAKNSPVDHKTALGYARASDLGLAVGSSFYGRSVVNTTDTLVAYVLEGDANLDGVVNALDFNALATGFGQNNGTQTWVNGDFNYDSTINTLDFNALAGNFNLTTPIPSPGAALGTLVPEPSAVALLAAGVLGLRRKRASISS